MDIYIKLMKPASWMMVLLSWAKAYGGVFLILARGKVCRTMWIVWVI